MTDILRYSLALLFVFGFFANNGYVLYSLPPEKIEAVATTQLNQLLQIIMLVVGWYFGSSAGSSAKDRALNNLSKP